MSLATRRLFKRKTNPSAKIVPGTSLPVPSALQEEKSRCSDAIVLANTLGQEQKVQEDLVGALAPPPGRRPQRRRHPQ